MLLPLNATRRVSHLDNGILDSRMLDCIIQVLCDKDDVSPLLVGLDSHDYFVHFLCTSCRMEYAGGTSAGGGIRILPEGVAECEGVPKKSWMTKCVVLKNEADVVVGKGICHNVSSDLIIDSDNQPLGDDRVAVQIAESLSEYDVPSDWMFQMRAWHIKRVFLNGASLYDHEQMNLFNFASQAARRRSRVGARTYDSSREQRNAEKIPKKEALFSTESIQNVATKTCCSRSCL